MITCPNCNHQNPEGASQCEACFTPLSANTDLSTNLSQTSCPNCGTPVQPDARFCGQCGYNLSPESPSQGIPSPPEPLPETIFSQVTSVVSHGEDTSTNLAAPSPIESSETVAVSSYESSSLEQGLENANSSPSEAATIAYSPEADTQGTEGEAPDADIELSKITNAEISSPNPETQETNTAVSLPQPPSTSTPMAATQLQLQTGTFLHVQTDTQLELPQGLDVIHIGKPNNQIPPDLDLTGFPNSEIVSRIHADIRVEGDSYYIEDMGSSNGTYINHTPLLPGNRHRLRPGDRVSLGKGDKVTFLFQLA